ncbi:MAG: glycosyltransferase family 2 protein [Chloroflexi bacterium]|nr:glycosyltransferase family 2 protein [Chloroflexota bacterium]
MTEFRHRIALIIPTRNRPELLEKLLQSLQHQTVHASQVIVVDGSDEPVETVTKRFAIPGISYVRVFPPSLAKQRNEGIKTLNDDITLAGYLDDDIILDKDAIEAMLRYWEECPDDVGGSSFHITNNELASPLVRIPGKLLGKLFWCDDFGQGKVLRSGFATPVIPVLKDTYTEWLCGGATVWKKEILEDSKYDEKLGGSSYVEDIDFSFRAAKHYRLVVIHGAKVQHYPPPFNPRKSYLMGRMNVHHHYHFVRKNPELSVPLFYWAILGEAIILLFASIPRRSSYGIYKAFGNIAGLFDLMRRRHFQTDQEFRK